VIRIGNLPKVPRPEWHNQPFHFWSLGFKIRPQTFLKLATRMTLTPPRDDFIYQMPKGDIYPVKLPIEEAVESLKTILASFIQPRKVQFPRLPEIKIKPKTYLLVYLPFIRTAHEYIQPDLKMVILKSQLTHAKNL
jgi:hypothetical protein